MCGRFTLTQSAATLAKFFHIQQVLDLEAQYNIAPTQMVATVLHNAESAKREFRQLRWGLIPSWAKDTGMGAKLINARAETVAEKPSFRSAFKHRRCLVVADGFYEWQKQPDKKAKDVMLSGSPTQEAFKKQPFYFRLQDGQPFGFAGLWEKWKNPDGEEISSCTILTTEANELLQPIHDRMPVILAPQDYDLWLDSQNQTPEVLHSLLAPYPASAMTTYPVSTLVNSPKHNSPECLIQIDQQNNHPNQLN